ncbi:MAG: tRNA (guanosine(37)-N1)-methyltransferase TrmD [Lachnospiraceae bacterium]
MNFHVLTLFPEMVLNGLSGSIIGKAIEKGSISVEAVNIRDFTEDKHKKVDDYPYGGGAGLLMQAQPVYDAHRDVINRIGQKKTVRTIYLTPQGRTFDQRMAEELAREEELIFLCGHYEGIDERALDAVVTDYVSLGDFVLTGGELPAMVMIDAIARLLPGVLHNDTSAAEESFSGYLLEYPQYSRPEVWRGEKVPEVLLSGDHKKIREWRLSQSIERTRLRRPDLYAEYERVIACRESLLKEKLHHMSMLALIERGQGKLLHHDDTGVLMQDRGSGAYMLTAKSREDGERILEQAFPVGEQPCLFVTHQAFLHEVIEKCFGLTVMPGCKQFVYTRKEALPAKSCDIRRLSVEYLDIITGNYDLAEEAYIKERLESGAIYGAFVDEELAGFIGEHQEGSMGMLFVFPAFRRRGLAEALETNLINRTLQKGYTPFCQVFEGNDISESLQEKLGLYCAKEKIWWHEMKF